MHELYSAKPTVFIVKSNQDQKLGIYLHKVKPWRMQNILWTQSWTEKALT